MVKKAIGLIETIGLVAAVEAADAAVKAANIELLGYELTRGGGMVVVKLLGDVGAVKAAVDAGAGAAGKVGTVWATHVIPRPHQELAGMVESRETVGRKTQPPITVVNEPPGPETAKVNEAEAETAMLPETDAAANPIEKPNSDLCNLCGDPACPRKKGDPKVTCRHYGKDNKQEDE